MILHRIETWAIKTQSDTQIEGASAGQSKKTFSLENDTKSRILQCSNSLDDLLKQVNIIMDRLKIVEELNRKSWQELWHALRKAMKVFTFRARAEELKTCIKAAESLRKSFDSVLACLSCDQIGLMYVRILLASTSS